jgi:serine phosphatase RsbU (regulator of sigma subunit)
MTDPRQSVPPDAGGTHIMLARAAPLPATCAAHFLVVADGPSAGQRFRVGETPQVIGRAPPADIVIEEPAISRRHCQVREAGGVAIIDDLGSTNGTLVGDARIAAPTALDDGALIDLGPVRLRYERLSEAEAEALAAAERDLRQAQAYVTALLPAPVTTGPILIDWVYHPCARVGGDGFGYRQMSETSFALYVLDVAGHGTGAAMHAVSVLNTLRRGTLAGADLREPASVVAALNAQYPMEAHGDLFFTLWYGVFDTSQRVLSFASAGHHAAFLRAPDGARLAPLWTRNVPVGVANRPAQAARVRVVPGCRLYLFSDGAFEFTPRDGGRHAIEQFVPLLTAEAEFATPEPERLWRANRARARPGPPEDDVSIVVVTFP